MSLKPKASFAKGELDPALRKRVTLAAFDSGLDTARNMVISKTGRILSRQARKHRWTAKLTDRTCKLFCPPNSDYLFEWGHQYVRVYTASTGTLLADLSHSWTESNLDNVQFVVDGASTLRIFCTGKTPLKIDYSSTPAWATDLYTVLAAPTNPGITPSGAPAGYAVEYLVTRTRNTGEESQSTVIATAGELLPIAAGQSNRVTARVQTGTSTLALEKEMRVYRRPVSGGAFGYIGSSSYYRISATDLYSDFTDLGGAADYSHQPPGDVADTAMAALAQCGAVYQQRLMVAEGANLEGIFASRPGLRENFYRNYPLDSDSALKLKAGTSGGAFPIWMIDSDGLVVFTQVGVFLHVGSLSPSNLALDKKSNCVIDYRVPPLTIPGGVIFVDSSTNTIRTLLWSTEASSYSTPEMSIYSDHLFLTKRVVSWAFQEGAIPLLWVIFNDGTFASFTYERDHEMRAWTRHDSSNDLNVEYVASSGQNVYFLVEKDGTRYVEQVVDRYVSVDDLEDDPEAYLGAPSVCMDSMKSYSTLLNDSLTGSDEMVIAETDDEDPGDEDDDEWMGVLKITCGSSGIFTSGSGNPGEVGAKFKWFHPVDKTQTIFTVTERVSNNEVLVQPDCQFDSDYATENPRLYQMKSTFTGLSHLEGEEPIIIGDGYVIQSPLDDRVEDSLNPVASGSITLPNDESAAIVHIGRPVVCDLKTLKIATVEQRPVDRESLTVNKLYVDVHRSHGFYVGNDFPDGDSIVGMQDIHHLDVDYTTDEEIIGNRPNPEMTKEIEVTIPGDWGNTKGQVAMRAVDGQHIEILAIETDLHESRREGS